MVRARSNRTSPPRRPVWILWVALVVVAAGGGLALLRGAASDSAGGAPARPVELSVAEAANRRAGGAFVLDVRQPEEWVEAHIPDSTLIPLGELAARIAEVPRDREIVVVCRSGNRSRQGAEILREAGYERVGSMAGGLLQWSAAGLPTVAGR